ncbi:MAG TPA: hypothetical protein VMS22_09750 [Candidatus Eisenbacteria bacterium]|nr:hypothetical protein [Candidatus Eisenbacteria bacterium]
MKSLILVAAIVLAAVPARAVDPTVEVNFDDSYCAVRPYPFQLEETIPATLRYLIDVGNGRKAYYYGCAQWDGFLFGPAGFEQGFIGYGGVIGFGEVGPGYIRAYGEALAGISPHAYRPPGFIMANNPYYATAAHIGGAAFVDMVTPPPTTAATNAGDASTLNFRLRLRCNETSNYLTLYTDTTIAAFFFTPDGYAQNPKFGYFDSQVNHTDVVHGTLHYPCPFDIPKTVNVKVGEPIVVRMSIGILASGGVVSYLYGGDWDQWSDALNTATMEITDTDGHAVTGASGHVYEALTLPTYTTTSTSTSTSTTLPPGPDTCGDGEVDAGEDCDCPVTDDEMLKGLGCTGSSVIPPQQPACVLCRQCHLLNVLCVDASVTTTSTTTIAGTTLAPGATTTTTLDPGAACTGLTGIPRAACLLETALAAPLCGAETIPPKVDKQLRGRLVTAKTLFGNASGKSGKALTKLMKRARRSLDASAAKATKAAGAKSPKKKISTACAATIGSIVGDVKAELPPAS